MNLIEEKTDEWQQEVWIAVIDFMKAFDSIEHSSIWTALAKQGVAIGYIKVLQNLYRDQCGRVNTDRPSRQFPITRGTKQGDPLSTLLFNAVLEDIFRDVQQKWMDKRHGIEFSLSDTDFLQNLRFADE